MGSNDQISGAYNLLRCPVTRHLQNTSSMMKLLTPQYEAVLSQGSPEKQNQ